MAKGTVKWFSDKKDYGFIEQEDDPVEKGLNFFQLIWSGNDVLAGIIDNPSRIRIDQ